MNTSLFPWLMAIGIGIITLAATGAKVLTRFPRRDLETYCRRKNRRSFFDAILDRHEDLSQSAETLQVIAMVAVAILIGLRLLERVDPAAATLPDILVLGAVAILLLLALTTWIPSAVVQLWSAPFIFHTWPLWIGISTLLWPFTMGLKLFNVLLCRLAGQFDHEDDEEEAFEDEIRTIVTAGLRDGLLEADAREMIEGVMELGDVDVAEIMTPRSEIDALDIQLEWPEMLQYIVQVGRTRLPVYQDRLDQVVGVLYVKDLLVELSKESSLPRTSLRALLREAWFVPMTKVVDELLREFRRTRNHMAIVVDEYGAVAGVVTIEDALEEIVGEIADESDDEEEVDLVRIDESTLEADGRVHIGELNEQFGLGLPESEEFDTIAGLVVHAMGQIPAVGDVITQPGLRLRVLKSSPRRVERVRVELLDENHP